MTGQHARRGPRVRGAEIPAPIERAVGDAVAHRLEAELGDRGLLLMADNLVAAEADAAQCGARLVISLIHRCYPITRQVGAEVALDFGGERGAARLQAALAFGAATARALAPDLRNPDVEFVCAMFNLGIGLVDGLCDEDAETGGALLALVNAHDLADAAEEPRARGWLRATLPPVAAGDPTAAFTADVIETFFEALHEVYPDDVWRRRIGMQLGAALEAERASVAPSADAARDQLLGVLAPNIGAALADHRDPRRRPACAFGTDRGDAARGGDVADRRPRRPLPGRTQRFAEWRPTLRRGR